MSVLSEAEKLVHGKRGSDYGHPSDHFGCVAEMWSAYATQRLGMPVKLTAIDVPIMMILLKTARLANKFKRDSLVDVAGYVATAEMVVEGKPDS